MKNGVGNQEAFNKIMISPLSTAGPQRQYNGKYLDYTVVFVWDCLSCLLQDIMNVIPTVLADLSHTPQHGLTIPSSRLTVIQIPYKSLFPETFPAVLKAIVSYF